jgi:hypothetical protein
VQLLWGIGWEVANAAQQPNWKPGAEYSRK